jgi:hypothetical protein
MAANAAIGYIDTAYNYRSRIYGASTANYNEISYSLSALAGKEITLCQVRVGQTVTLYINGAATTPSTASSTPPGWDATVTGTYFCIGYSSSATVSPILFKHSRVYNVGLTAAEAQAEYTSGIPNEYQWSGASLLTDATRNGVFSVAGTDWVSNQAGGSPVTLTYGSGTLGIPFNAANQTVSLPVTALTPGFLMPGKAYEVSFDVTGYAGSGTQTLKTNNNSVTYATGLTGNGTWRAHGTNLTYTTSTVFQFVTTAAASFSIANFTLSRCGCVLDLDLGYGCPRQYPDRGPNGLHAVSTGNVLDAVPMPGTRLLRGTTNTSGNQQLLGVQAQDASTRWITRILAKASTGTPAITIGNVSAGAQIVASTTLSTSWQSLTLATNINSTGNYWVNSNSSAVISLIIEHIAAP